MAPLHKRLRFEDQSPYPIHPRSTTGRVRVGLYDTGADGMGTFSTGISLVPDTRKTFRLVSSSQIVPHCFANSYNDHPPQHIRLSTEMLAQFAFINTKWRARGDITHVCGCSFSFHATFCSSFPAKNRASDVRKASEPMVPPPLCVMTFPILFCVLCFSLFNKLVNHRRRLFRLQRSQLSKRWHFCGGVFLVLRIEAGNFRFFLLIRHGCDVHIGWRHSLFRGLCRNISFLMHLLRVWFF